METIEVIKTRRSIRNFINKPISKEHIEEIIDSARLAPTANNVQPWEFVVVTNEQTRKKLAQITDYGYFIADSPVCIVVFCKSTKYYLEDGCAAIENILLSAWTLGIGSCWVAGDKKSYAEDINKLLSVPITYKLIGLIALGYPAKQSYSISKRSLEEVIHWEKF